MKKYKKIAVLLCLALMVSLLLSTLAFAASGDVAGAIEGTWNNVSEQIKTVVNKVVFPAIDQFLQCFSLPNSERHTLTIENTDNLIGWRLRFYLLALYLLLQHQHIFGRFWVCSKKAGKRNAC